MRPFVKLVQKLGGKHSTWQVFEDFLAMASISISNALCMDQRREQQYLDIIKRYSKDELDAFGQMLAYLTEALQAEVESGHLTDILGAVFHELELNNKYHGQVFSPQHPCDFMGKISYAGSSSDLCPEIEESGFVSLAEPTCGSGTMVIGFANALLDAKYNYCSQMVATCTDIDLKCVHMTYLQLSLYGIPAVVIHGNTLTMEEWSHWYTPVYVLNRWDLRRQMSLGRSALTVPDLPMQTTDSPAKEPDLVTNSHASQANSKGQKQKPAPKSVYEQLSLF